MEFSYVNNFVGLPDSFLTCKGIAQCSEYAIALIDTVQDLFRACLHKSIDLNGRILRCPRVLYLNADSRLALQFYYNHRCGIRGEQHHYDFGYGSTEIIELPGGYHTPRTLELGNVNSSDQTFFTHALRPFTA